MPRDFYPTTAEQVIEVVAAVSASGRTCSVADVAAFVDTSLDAASNALAMAADLGFLVMNGTDYVTASPLCRFTRTTQAASKAAILRVSLESYEPFVLFRLRLLESGRVDIAATQVKSLQDLSATRSQVGETLISFGTFAGAIEAKGAGLYAVPRSDEAADLSTLAVAAADEYAAELAVRRLLGQRAADAVSRTEVVQPLAKAFVHANSGDPDAAVQEAGNAIESFLTEYGNRAGIDTATKHGIKRKGWGDLLRWAPTCKAQGSVELLGPCEECGGSRNRRRDQRILETSGRYRGCVCSRGMQVHRGLHFA